MKRGHSRHFHTRRVRYWLCTVWMLVFVSISLWALWHKLQLAIDPSGAFSIGASVRGFYADGLIRGSQGGILPNCEVSMRVEKRGPWRLPNDIIVRGATRTDRYGIGVMELTGVRVTARLDPDPRGMNQGVPDGTVVDMKSLGLLWNPSEPLYSFGTGPDNRFLTLPINTIRPRWSASGLAKSLAVSAGIASVVLATMIGLSLFIRGLRERSSSRRLAHDLCPRCGHPLPIRRDLYAPVLCVECGHAARPPIPRLEPDERPLPPSYPKDWSSQ
jgi:hypothetical protein